MVLRKTKIPPPLSCVTKPWTTKLAVLAAEVEIIPKVSQFQITQGEIINTATKPETKAERKAAIGRDFPSSTGSRRWLLFAKIILVAKTHKMNAPKKKMLSNRANIIKPPIKPARTKFLIVGQSLTLSHHQINKVIKESDNAVSKPFKVSNKTNGLNK